MYLGDDIPLILQGAAKREGLGQPAASIMSPMTWYLLAGGLTYWMLATGRKSRGLL